MVEMRVAHEHEVGRLDLRGRDPDWNQAGQPVQIGVEEQLQSPVPNAEGRRPEPLDRCVLDAHPLLLPHSRNARPSVIMNRPSDCLVAANPSRSPSSPSRCRTDGLNSTACTRLAVGHWSGHTLPGMPTLSGSLVRLQPATLDGIPALAAIRRAPEVHARWRGGEDMVAAVTEDFDEPRSTPYVIELDGRVVGWIQWSAEDEPDYRYATIDIYLDPAVHGRGLGTDAVRTWPGISSTATVITAWKSTRRPTTRPPFAAT